RLVQALDPGKETEDIRQWLQQIEVVRQEATGARTVIGVVSNTRARKSSVINAILDEERLNPSEDESSKYRAEIEFIKPAEWEKELRVLFEEIIDGSGNISREEKPELTKDSDDEDEDEDISKGTGEEDKKKKKTRKREQEFWPLIKVVRLYVKADALSTSAVLVDLPGVVDSNIVSPINRAVDDKAAKNLLGSAFRRQLKFDGTYSAITFICSKTDDISNTEAADSLGLRDEFEELKEQLTSIERRRRAAEKESSKLRDQKASLRETMDNCDDEIEKWEALREKLDDGKTVYAPAAKTKKRKRSSSESDSEDEDKSSDNSDNESQASDRKLKTQKKEARRRRSEIEAEVTDLNNKIKELKVEARNIEDNKSQICIDARNQYSKSAIQVDFAAGIKETAADEDPDTFNPKEDLRDYEKVAKDLPVYCVSSRAYQKLAGRLVKDNAVRGFTDVEQTEIPALKLHCKRLTEKGGLYWATYKAVVRRQGVFTGSGGLSDFNAQLTEPIYKHLANGWEKAF
ncbi:hypothetical protein KCU73_g9964, partial [Aureobasidium melanogenum]